MCPPGFRTYPDAVLKLHRECDSGEVSNALPDAQNRRKLRLRINGAIAAEGASLLGVPHLFRSTGRRGGARNRADRVSDALSAAQIANLAAAADHASRIGLPLSRMITIHWQAAGVPLDGMARATGRFVDLLGKTLRRHDAEPCWLWVHESGPNKGGHVHLLAHVPARLVPALTRLQRRWCESIAGQSYRTKVIKSEPIGRRLGLEASNPALHAANVAAVMAYVLKGADPEAAAQFGLERLEPGGRVTGKRCATSQNIGAKARISSTAQRPAVDP